MSNIWHGVFKVRHFAGCVLYIFPPLAFFSLAGKKGKIFMWLDVTNCIIVL
jgi:hypothetical protein